MAKKKKAVQSTNATEQGAGGSDELVEEEVTEPEAEVTEAGQFSKQEDDVAKRMIMRRKLEKYLEERRLKKELGDDYDL
ncbi:MAG: hypothetical protein HY080_01380 [Gammaproteobacteria bacterium]|nr:hypothetical protein [Gammaproteobacteria bacterium]